MIFKIGKINFDVETEGEVTDAFEAGSYVASQEVKSKPRCAHCGINSVQSGATICQACAVKLAGR